MVLRSSRMGISSVKQQIRILNLRQNRIKPGDIVEIYTWSKHNRYDWVLAVCVREYMEKSFDCCVLESKELKHVHLHNIKKVTNEETV